MLRPRIARAVTIDMAEIPRLPGQNLQPTASAAHAASRHFPCPGPSQSLMLYPIAPLSGLESPDPHRSSVTWTRIGERNSDCAGSRTALLKTRLRVSSPKTGAGQTAGLNGTGGPKLRFHDLRHAYASLLIDQGEQIVWISRQLGHASPAITLSVYAGLFAREEHAARMRSRMEASFGSILDGRGTSGEQNASAPGVPESGGRPGTGSARRDSERRDIAGSAAFQLTSRGSLVRAQYRPLTRRSPRSSEPSASALSAQLLEGAERRLPRSARRHHARLPAGQPPLVAD